MEAYKEQIKIKQNEEKEMVKVLKEYKSKYQEFEKATKTSKSNYR